MPSRHGPLRAPRHAAPSPRRARLRLAGLSTVALALVAGTALAVAPSPAGASTPVYLGSAGDSAALSRSIGAPVSDHAYGRFDRAVPVGRMITVKGGTWHSVATATAGTALYAN